MSEQVMVRQRAGRIGQTGDMMKADLKGFGDDRARWLGRRRPLQSSETLGLALGEGDVRVNSG